LIRLLNFGNPMSQRSCPGGLDMNSYNMLYGKMRQLCVAEPIPGECADDAAPGRAPCPWL